MGPSNDHQCVFWRGGDGRIREAWYTSGWHGPRTMGWSSASAPAVAITSSGHQYVFWQGPDGGVWEGWYFTKDGHPYTYDDMPAGRSDPQLAHFSIAHDQAYILPALRQMLAINPQTTLFATPWTAPPWMKANDAFDDLGGRGRLLPSAYQPLASYFVKFLQGSAAQGVPVAAIAPENEPNAWSSFPAMLFPEPYQHSPTNYGVTSGLDDVALLNPDGSRVLVAYNNSSAAIRFAVNWDGRSFTYSLAAQAMVTFRWNP